MSVASLELCKELYELSGWKPDEGHWYNDMYAEGEVKLVRFPVPYRNNGRANVIIPAYDLGYLLRKLPEDLTTYGKFRGEWYAHFSGYGKTDEKITYATTPEDAAASLAIELFKQGVLKK